MTRRHRAGTRVLVRAAIRQPAIAGARVARSARTAAEATTPERSPPEPLGSIVGGRYRLERVLAKGGFAMVYGAVEIGLARRVAVKVLLPEHAQNPQLRARVHREAVLLARIRHPHVVAIHGFGFMASGTPFAALELIDGRPLREAIARNRLLTLIHVLDIGVQMTRAVHAAHRQGILHRDLKPENIMLAKDPDRPGRHFAKLIDFGIAQFLHDARAERCDRKIALTEPGRMVGSPHYMAPEHIMDGAIDERSDIYQLGLILYEMVAGRAPFPGPSHREVMIQHATAPVPPFDRESRQGRCPVELEHLILRCLAKDPGERCPSAGILAAELEQIAAGLGARK